MAGLGAAAVVPSTALARATRLTAAARVTVGPNASTYLFFDAGEADFIEAACERLIPADAGGPGAQDVGVVEYVDRQLAGPWGAGKQCYREGPWQPGTPPPYQVPSCQPAQLFRTALSAIRRDLVTRGVSNDVSFGGLPTKFQDGYLRFLEAGRVDLGGVPSALFFRLLLAMTVEGFFSHPGHGTSRDRVNWRMHGFPGAHASSA